LVLGTAQLRASQHKPGRKQTAESANDCPRLSGHGITPDRTNEQRKQGQTVRVSRTATHHAIGNRHMDVITDNGIPRVQYTKGTRRAAEHFADIVTTTTTLFVTTATAGFVHADNRIFAVNGGNAALRINHGFKL
jgi:hypothetical protein